jgi:outer membrane autotransporter protein
MDNFTFAGNKVSFSDDADAARAPRLRIGTSHVGKDGTLVEPFVVGSVWGDFSGDNKATVNSLGTVFGPFKDKGDDVWGVVLGGLNIFSPSGKSSAFAKADYAIGEDLDGISAKLGMRYNW